MYRCVNEKFLELLRWFRKAERLLVEVWCEEEVNIGGKMMFHNPCLSGTCQFALLMAWLTAFYHSVHSMYVLVNAWAIAPEMFQVFKCFLIHRNCTYYGGTVWCCGIYLHTLLQCYNQCKYFHHCNHLSCLHGKDIQNTFFQI